MDILTKEVGLQWYTEGLGTERMGTIGDDALEHIHRMVRDVTDSVVYDIGAGYGAVVMALRLLGIPTSGCERCKRFCDRANEIGQKYFTDWQPIQCCSFQNVTLNPYEDTLYYVNNLAFGQDQKWLVKALQPLDVNEDNCILSTDSIPGLGSKLERCKPGDAFTLMKVTGKLPHLHTDLHMENISLRCWLRTTCSVRLYFPVQY